ncbi:MAG: hypothetical protein ACD_46C00039G0002 [uncultured bacterium]|nr:MAG: hypothetical protein ACD_46C00039G0002 [uncultured bacterium]
MYAKRLSARQSWTKNRGESAASAWEHVDGFFVQLWQRLDVRSGRERLRQFFRAFEMHLRH